jgi:hypothetical protein
MVPLVGVKYLVTSAPEETETVAVQLRGVVLDWLLNVNVHMRLPGPTAQSVETLAMAVGVTVRITGEGTAVGDGTTVGASVGWRVGVTVGGAAAARDGVRTVVAPVGGLAELVGRSEPDLFRPK